MSSFNSGGCTNAHAMLEDCATRPGKLQAPNWPEESLLCQEMEEKPHSLQWQGQDSDHRTHQCSVKGLSCTRNLGTQNTVYFKSTVPQCALLICISDLAQTIRNDKENGIAYFLSLSTNTCSAAHFFHTGLI